MIGLMFGLLKGLNIYFQIFKENVVMIYVMLLWFESFAEAGAESVL